MDENEIESKLLQLGYLSYDSFEINTKYFKNEDKDVAAVLTSFASLGYTIEYESLPKIKYSYDLEKFYSHFFDLLKKSKGDVKHKIFYKNFPNLKKLSKYDYIVNAVLHYLTVEENDYGYFPSYIETTFKEKENIELAMTTLSIISKNNAIEILKKYYMTLLESNKAISGNDFEIIKYLIKTYNVTFNPSVIPFHENMIRYIFVCTYQYEDSNEVLEHIDLSFVKTISDVLDLFEGLFIEGKIKRKSRRIILNKLEAICSVNKYHIDDFVADKETWKNVFKVLHVGEYVNKYPKVYQAAYKLRDNSYETLNSKIMKALDSGDKNIYNILSIRPGYFARMIDFVLRNDKFDYKDTLNCFNSVISKISTTVLISLLDFYKNRNNLGNKRYFLYRQDYSYNVLSVDETRTSLDENIITDTINLIENEIKNRYSNQERIDDVYLDECMKNYTLPLNNLNASSGFNTLSFGSKVKLDNKNLAYLRLFTHWKNNGERVDIDLSIQFYNENLEYIDSLSWFNMSSGKKYDSYHSGDIITAPHGASEFIDINIVKAKKHARYVVVCNNSYTCQAFSDIKECFTGVMFRSKKGRKGELFKAKTVKTKFDLIAKETISHIGFVIDLYDLTMYWCDISTYGGNIALEDYGAIIDALTKSHITLYDLVKLHCKHVSFTTKENAKAFIDDSPSSILAPTHLDQIVKWIG